MIILSSLSIYTIGYLIILPKVYQRYKKEHDDIVNSEYGYIFDVLPPKIESVLITTGWPIWILPILIYNCLSKYLDLFNHKT